jgi:hypothetical protein
MIVSHNGNSFGEDRQKPEFDWFEWANRMGIVVEDKHVQMAAKMHSDPEYKAQIKKEWIARLEAKSKRLVVSGVDKKASEISKDQAEIMKQIIAYINNHSNSRGVNNGLGQYQNVNDGFISKDDLEQGIRVVYNISGKRSANDKVKMLEASKIIEWTEIGVIKGKPHGKRSRGAFIINMDLLNK